MMLGSSETEWVMKLGPISRTNQAQSREQAESGALQKVDDAVKAIMEKVRPAIPLLKEGAQCSGGGMPEVKEELPDVLVHSYQLDKGDWFSMASSGAFGVKLVCKK